MPHSSGGGSHSGGSHSGGSHSSYSSHSSGGGSSRSSRRTSSQPFPGAKRYVYYRDHKPYLIYSNYDIRKPDRSNLATIIVIGGMFGSFSLLGLILAFTAFSFPKRIEYSEYKKKDPEIIIEDNLGIFEDEDRLEDSMEEFYDVTGIVPAVITVSNSDWNEDYKSLEAYAYDVYVNRVPDEVHWLIVYSEDIKDNGFNDWYWEGMQGDRTDPVLTESRANKFNESLQTRLLQRDKYSVDEAIAATFDQYTPTMMGMIVDTGNLFAGLFMFMMMGGFAAMVVFTNKPRKVPDEYKNAIPCNLNAVYQESCNFCGGVYIIGIHTECPHCGGAIPPHHYGKDPQGNIIQIM